MPLMILLLALSWRSVMFVQDSSCCRLDIEPSAGAPTELVVVVTNLNDAPVTMVRWANPAVNLRIKIDVETGDVPELTEQGKLIRSGQPLNGSMLRTMTLNNGEKTMAEVLDLRTLYMLKTGRYVVTVLRDVYIGDKKIELQRKTTILVP